MSSEKDQSDPYDDIENIWISKLERAIERLDVAKWKNEYGSELDTVRKTHVEMTRTYYFVSMGTIKGTACLLFCLLMIDLMIEFQSYIYGLSANIWGTMFIIYPSLRGRYLITAIVEDVDQSLIRELEIKKMAFTNTGFGLLILGFGLQIFAHQSTGDEFLSWNFLENVIPGWFVFPLLLIAFYLSTRVVSR